jgi:hypothetical protein
LRFQTFLPKNSNPQEKVHPGSREENSVHATSFGHCSALNKAVRTLRQLNVKLREKVFEERMQLEKELADVIPSVSREELMASAKQQYVNP